MFQRYILLSGNDEWLGVIADMGCSCSYNFICQIGGPLCTAERAVFANSNLGDAGDGKWVVAVPTESLR